MEQLTAPRLDLNDLGCKAEMFFRVRRINSRIACGKVFAFCMVALIFGGVLSGMLYSLVTGGSIVLGLLAGGLIAAQLASVLTIFTAAVSELANFQQPREIRFESLQPVTVVLHSADLRRQHRPPRHVA